jgi:hypothetical protein
MKLYIKTNTLKALKNLDDLLPSSLSKTSILLDKNSNQAYIDNLKCSYEILKHKEKIFFDTRELKHIVKGIYFGNTQCEHLLSPFVEVLEAQNICKTKHYNFVFCLPPLSQFKLEELKEILEFLNTNYTEIVVNDFGALQMVLEYENLKPILGINFTKIIKNAFIDKLEIEDISDSILENQKTLLSHCEFEQKSVREFYKELGVSRFSIENNKLNIDFINTTPKMLCDFYYPNITISSSKACDIAGLFDDKSRYFVQKSCHKYCHQVSLEFAHSKVLGLYQRYNTIYKTHKKIELDKNLYKDAKNRFVWEVF